MLAPRQAPPPSRVVQAKEAAGICSHEDLGGVARFHGHFNASDGNHYHGWEPPMDKVFWVVC